MKLLIDNSLTPIELARLKYQRLYERQVIAKCEAQEMADVKPKNLIIKFFQFING